MLCDFCTDKNDLGQRSQYLNVTTQGHHIHGEILPRHSAKATDDSQHHTAETNTLASVRKTSNDNNTPQRNVTACACFTVITNIRRKRAFSFAEHSCVIFPGGKHIVFSISSLYTRHLKAQRLDGHNYIIILRSTQK